MNALHRRLLTLAAALAVGFIVFLGRAQDTKSKGSKMVFPPGSKVPDGITILAAEGQSLDETVRKQIDDFFSGLEQHQVDTAYDALVKGTKIAERTEDVATLKSKTQQAIELFGDLQGHEFVGAKSVGSHLLNATYMSLGKLFPLRWRFYYYNSGDGWKLVDIRVDDRLADMFGEPLPADQQQSSRAGNWQTRPSP
jgi:hypothetical protein